MNKVSNEFWNKHSFLRRSMTETEINNEIDILYGQELIDFSRKICFCNVSKKRCCNFLFEFDVYE